MSIFKLLFLITLSFFAYRFYMKAVPFKKKPALSKVPSLSSNAFDAEMLRTSPDYRGSALVAFVDEPSTTSRKLIRALSEAKYLIDIKGYPLKIAQVKCAKYADVCEQFVVSGNYPTLIWFKAGTSQGQYPDEHSAVKIVEWASKENERGMLVQ